jgi:biopolymer transport protein ExbB
MTRSTFRRILPYALAALSVTVFPVLGFAEEEAAAHQEQSILHTIIEGGPLIMAVWGAILATSITMVTLVIQNSLQLRKDRLAPPPLINALRQLISAGNYQEAWETCNANRNYLSNVIKAGLSRIGRGKDAVEQGLAEHALREATVLRTRNSYLSVIGVVSPMIGLLGTVIGMMGAFAVLASSGISDPRALSGKIGEVLMATAFGIGIAIPAFVAYYVFRNVSQMCIVHADDVVNALIVDLPYEELHGVQIGENFNAGVVQSSGPRKISASLSTNCPMCSGVVNVGVNPCPHCGSPLDWN